MGRRDGRTEVCRRRPPAAGGGFGVVVALDLGEVEIGDCVRGEGGESKID
jgi:hypothetical protein